MRAKEFIIEAIDPNIKFELDKILSRNWKGSAAEKILLGQFLKSDKGTYARNVIGNNNHKEFIDHITAWLKNNQPKLQQQFDEVDFTDLESLASDMYVSYLATQGQLEEAYQGGLRKWFKQKWVNLAKKKKGGRGYEPCGTSGKTSGYAKCVPSKKASQMSDKEKKSAISRKRTAQRKAGRPGRQSGGKGQAPILVKTKVKEDYKSNFDQTIDDMITKIYGKEAQRKVADLPRYLVYSQNSGLEMDTNSLNDAIYAAELIANRELDSPSLVYDRKTKYPVVAYNGSEDVWYKTNPSSPKLNEENTIDEVWSKKYKKSINCSNPKGFSQKAHCAGRKARQAGKHTKSNSVNK